MTDFLKVLKARISDVYFIIVFTVLTLYMHDGYFDTLQAKAKMLLGTSFFYVAAMLMVCIILLLCNKEREWKIWKKWTALEWGLLIFAILAVVSASFSSEKTMAFRGSDGCELGAIALFLLCLSSLFLITNLKLSKPKILVIIVSGYIVFAWGITNCFDLDFMHWYEDMISSPYDYLSTIGNRDWYVGYLALTLPFVAALFLYEEKRIMTALYAVYLYLGFINLYITKGDGNLLIFGCAIPLVYCALKDQNAFYRLIKILWIFILASITVRIFCCFVDPMHVTGVSILGKLEEIHWYVILALFAVVLQIFGKKIVAIRLEKIWIGISLLVIVVLFVLVTVKFSGSFGSNRGYIWSYSVKTFQELDMVQKIIGWGPDCFKTAVYSKAGDSIATTWPENNMIANAHNEILQYLVTMGIVGMLSFVYMFVSAWTCKNKHHSVFRIAAQTAVFAYFCTALGNNPQPLNYGILFVMFAIVRCESKEREMEDCIESEKICRE